MQDYILLRSLFINFLLHAQFSIGQDFKPGKLISYNNETLSVNLITYKRPKDKAIYNQYIQISDSSGNYKKIKPKQIKSFIVGKEIYESIHFTDTSTKQQIYLFAKVLNKGKVNLYSTMRIAEFNIEAHFFKRPAENYFHIFREQEIIDLGEGPYKIYGFNRESVFKQYFESYLSDCPEVSRKVHQGFYTIYDIELLIKDYNTTCR